MEILAGRDPAPNARRWHPLLWLAIAAILLLPLLAMRFTREVNWTASDFLAAAVLLGSAGAIFELAARLIPARVPRWLFAAGLVGLVAMVWADGAVGIF